MSEFRNVPVYRGGVKVRRTINSVRVFADLENLKIQFDESKFLSNIGKENGGVIFGSEHISHIIINSCLFADNTAWYAGGGIYIVGPEITMSTDSQIVSNIFRTI